MLISVVQRRKTRGLRLQAVALCVLSLLSFSAYSADSTVSARKINSASPTSSGVKVDYSLQARIANQPTRYRTVSKTYSPSRIVQITSAKKLTNPASAAVNAALVSVAAAAGWVIDELTGQVTGTTEGDFEDDGTYQAGYFYHWNDLPYIGSPQPTWDGPTETLACTQSGGVISGDYCVYQGAYWALNPVLRNCAHYGPTAHNGCALTPSTSEPVPESEWWPQLQDALTDLTPEDWESIFSNSYGLPETTPELQSELDAWAADLQAEGLTTETQEQTSTDTPDEVQEVILKDDSMPSDISDTIKGQYTGSEFSDRTTDVQTTVDGAGPSLDFVPDLPSYGSCQSIPFEWNGTTIQVPGATACGYFEVFKNMLGYLLYILTALTIFEIFFRPKQV